MKITVSRARSCAGSKVCSFLATLIVASSAAAAAPTITPVAPLTGLHHRPWNESAVRLDVRGFAEREFFISGTASQSNQPYRTRLLVRYPTDPSKFNGTVVVEWLNVSGGFDYDIVGSAVAELITRDGYAFVAASAQPVGVAWLRKWDPDRYGTLSHPDIPNGPLPPFIFEDSASDQIFTQIGQVVRDNTSTSPLAGLKVRHVVAVGQSQSAGRLTKYVNGSLWKNFDGYLLLNGPGPISNSEAKVVGVNSEFEVHMRLTRFNGDPSPLPMPLPKLDDPNAQPDGANFRLYEIAGAGHTPKLSMASVIARTTLDLPRFNPDATCKFGSADMDDQFAIQAALANLVRWIADGIDPPHAAPLKLNKDEKGRVEVARDAYGNVLGGVRLPAVSVPRGRHVGVNSAESTTGGPTTAIPPNLLCMLRGGFEPFDDAALKRLYPTPAAYVAKVKSATEDLVKQRLLLPADAAAIVSAAESEPGT